MGKPFDVAGIQNTVGTRHKNFVELKLASLCFALARADEEFGKSC
jgi:hypothetical protein